MHLSTTDPIAVHDNPLRNKRLQRIARVIKAKGKKGKLEETFSSKRQATRIFVYRKNKSCSLFSTHEQRYPRAYRVISFAVHPPFLYVYIYIQYTSLDRRNNGIVRARENCNSAVVAVHACATTVPRNRCATPTRIENRKRSPRSPRVWNGHCQIYNLLVPEIIVVNQSLFVLEPIFELILFEIRGLVSLVPFERPRSDGWKLINSYKLKVILNSSFL